MVKCLHLTMSALNALTVCMEMNVILFSVMVSHAHILLLNAAIHWQSPFHPDHLVAALLALACSAYTLTITGIRDYFCCIIFIHKLYNEALSIVLPLRYKGPTY